MRSLPGTRQAHKNIYSQILPLLLILKSTSQSTFVPINCDDKINTTAANVFGCNTSAMPFTYLGHPLDTKKTIFQELKPLVCQFERRLTSTLSMISHGANLSLLKLVTTFLTIFALFTLKFSPKILDLLDRICG